MNDVITFSNLQESRYDRQELISWWDQKRLSRARIIVAGAGALGNEVLKLLALTGIGHITVIDFDTISPSNLARMVLFREQDIGRPKVAVAAERLREINPDVEVTPIQEDLRFGIGLGDYRSADIVIGCLDSVNARWALNRKCMQAGVEWINGAISDFHGLIEHYQPGEGACYECNFTQSTYERFNKRYSCPFGLVADQADEKVPTTAITTSVIAGYQVQQALMILHGIEGGLCPGERLTVFMKPFIMNKDRLPVNAECLAHLRISENVPTLPINPQATIKEAIHLADQYLPGADQLVLPFDLLTSFHCPTCNQDRPVNRPKEKVYNHETVCPECSSTCTPMMTTTISMQSELAELQLEDIGIPPREILEFACKNEQAFIQIN